MHTETNTLLNNNMQHQQLYMSHLSQDHLIPETHNQHLFNPLPSTIDTASTSLNEGLYAPAAPQQHLTSECLSQYYNSATSRHGCPTTSSSSSPSSSSSSSSSNDSHYSRPNSSAQQHCKNNDNNLNRNAGILGVNLRVTGQCSQGGRKYMEDYFSVAYQQSENVTDLEYAFIGIYDGHGGAEAAKFAKEHLMMEIINQRLFWSDNDHDVLRAIREGYIATHYAMWRQQEKWPKTANGLPSTAGTTATVAFIRREKIYIGHVGDSGIVLGYQNENENFWRAKQLTTDHKPESVEERTRIINSGGKVVIKSGVPRVVWNRPRNSSHRGPIRKKTLIDEIPFLAVARSLGDLWSYNSERNEFVVSPDPDVKVIPINPKTFRCLIFGTDGLWNVVTAQEAVNTVHEKEVINERLLVQRGDSPYEGNQWTNPSKSLVDQALRTWSNKKMRADNTSVVTVILYPPGQGETGKEFVCNEAVNTPNNPPAFLQPISYGLEYTQVQAEVPAYDNATTYKEMALKYLPPEAYRDFNYYADGSDTEGEENEESEDDEEEEEEEQEVLLNPAATGGDLQPNTNYQQNLPNPNDWNWQANNTNIPTQITYAEDRQVVEGDEEEDEEEEDEEEEEEEENITAEGTDSQNNERQVCILNYQNYVHMDAEETNNATDSYINTFAESYNSILTASQDDCVSAATSSSSSSSSSSSKSNSNSNSNFQSVTPPNMRAILQEQHLYQQQCMSEEEGYSLTKLETRREQQTCKLEERTTHLTSETTAAVQTFKIFHETTQPQQIELYDTNTERFYAQQHQFMQQVQPKPLELHSLLQQEREEEQQVAYERMQQQQQHHQNIAAYACLQAVNSIPNPVLEEQPSVEVEYLEEESSLMEDEIIEEDSTALQQDETVQINEISSSSCGVGLILDESNSELELSQEQEFIEKIEIIPNVIYETNAEAEAEVEESQVLTKSSKLEPFKVSQNSICIPPPTLTAPAPSSLTITTLKSNQKHSKRAKFSYLYNNVPNENLQRISTKHSLYHGASNSTGNRRGSVCMTPSVNMTPPTVTSTPMIQRQLRSTSSICANSPNTTPIIEYGKRTLRARNSLAKDMKAKANLVQAALKYPHNAVTRNFLRATTANLMVGKPLLINDLNVTPCSRRSLAANNNIRPSNRSSIKTRREKSGVTINGSLNQSKAHIQNSPDPQLNLRSRQPVATPSSVTTPPSTNISSLRSLPATSTPVMKRASLTEHRILRSTHTRSTSSKSSQTPANFSKSTRTQSTGSNLAAPPPSPKLINAAAAVAAATRARSLLNAKHAAAANGTQSAVSAVFGKRSSLRSNGSTHPAVMPSSNSANLPSPASTHQTLRGRIVKKMKR